MKGHEYFQSVGNLKVNYQTAEQQESKLVPLLRSNDQGINVQRLSNDGHETMVDNYLLRNGAYIPTPEEEQIAQTLTTWATWIEASTKQIKRQLQQSPQNIVLTSLESKRLANDEARLLYHHIFGVKPKQFSIQPVTDQQTPLLQPLQIKTKQYTSGSMNKHFSGFGIEIRKQLHLQLAQTLGVTLKNFNELYGQWLLKFGGLIPMSYIDQLFDYMYDAITYFEYDGSPDFAWPDTYQKHYQPSLDSISTHPENMP